jgi:hypothetical protein
MTQHSQPVAVQAIHPAAGAESIPGQYMLTLCDLSAPVRIRAPESQSMRQFRFFMSRTRALNGTEQLRLHMGYFDSLVEARKWAQTMRARFPLASPERVPQRILQQRGPDPSAAATAPASAADVPMMTDTQVLRVLEARRFTPAEATQEDDVRGISLVGPDDTQTRLVLKDAVMQGAPVLFAVQMLQSAAEIALANVPSLSIFRAYTLYKTKVSREGHTSHCLRLGFFKDAISAKQVAYYVRAHFGSVAVVPVTEVEHALAKESPIDPAQLSNSFPQSIEPALDLAPTPPAAAPIARKPVLQAVTPPAKRRDSLDQTLEMLAASEVWNDPDSLSETGVRHLKLEVQKKKSR